MVPGSLVLAFDLGGTKLAGALVTADGRLLADRAVPVGTPRPAAVLRDMTAIAATLLTRRQGHVEAAGIAVPGLTRRDGTVWAPNLGWQRVAIGRLLQRRLGVPVAMDSDRNASVLGEAWRGAARGRRDVIVVTVGTGIGAGILSGGRLVRGAHELSGCLGWTVVGPWKRRVHGRLGYLESVAAGPAIAKAAKRKLTNLPRGPGQQRRRPLLDASDVADAARDGDATAARAYREAGHQLGLAVGNLVSLFDPEVIVFTGGLVHASPLWFDAMRTAALATCQPLAARRVRFAVSRLGHRANLLGAARLALEQASEGAPASR
jgi:glucokinase